MAKRYGTESIDNKKRNFVAEGDVWAEELLKIVQDIRDGNGDESFCIWAEELIKRLKAESLPLSKGGA